MQLSKFRSFLILSYIVCIVTFSLYSYFLMNSHLISLAQENSCICSKPIYTDCCTIDSCTNVDDCTCCPHYVDGNTCYYDLKVDGPYCDGVVGLCVYYCSYSSSDSNKPSSCDPYSYYDPELKKDVCLYNGNAECTDSGWECEYSSEDTNKPSCNPYAGGDTCYYNGHAECTNNGWECEYSSAESPKPSCDDVCGGTNMKTGGYAECTDSGWECEYSNTFTCDSSNCGVSQTCDGTTYYCIYESGTGWHWDTSKPSDFCCSDSDCSTEEYCDFGTHTCKAKESNCFDDVDNDGDGLTDYCDPDCKGAKKKCPDTNWEWIKEVNFDGTESECENSCQNDGWDGGYLVYCGVPTTCVCTKSVDCCPDSDDCQATSCSGYVPYCDPSTYKCKCKTSCGSAEDCQPNYCCTFDIDTSQEGECKPLKTTYPVNGVDYLCVS